MIGTITNLTAAIAVPNAAAGAAADFIDKWAAGKKDEKDSSAGKDTAKTATAIKKLAGKESDVRSESDGNTAVLVKQGEAARVAEDNSSRLQRTYMDHQTDRLLDGFKGIQATVLDALVSIRVTSDTHKNEQSLQSKIALGQAWLQWQTEAAASASQGHILHFAQQSYVAQNQIATEIVKLHGFMSNDSADDTKLRLAEMKVERHANLEREQKIHTLQESSLKHVGLAPRTTRSDLETMSNDPSDPKQQEKARRVLKMTRAGVAMKSGIKYDDQLKSEGRFDELHLEKEDLAIVTHVLKGMNNTYGKEAVLKPLDMDEEKWLNLTPEEQDEQKMPWDEMNEALKGARNYGLDEDRIKHTRKKKHAIRQESSEVESAYTTSIDDGKPSDFSGNNSTGNDYKARNIKWQDRNTTFKESLNDVVNGFPTAVLNQGSVGDSLTDFSSLNLYGENITTGVDSLVISNNGILHYMQRADARAKRARRDGLEKEQDNLNKGGRKGGRGVAFGARPAKKASDADGGGFLSSLLGFIPEAIATTATAVLGYKAFKAFKSPVTPAVVPKGSVYTHGGKTYKGGNPLPEGVKLSDAKQTVKSAKPAAATKAGGFANTARKAGAAVGQIGKVAIGKILTGAVLAYDIGNNYNEGQGVAEATANGVTAIAQELASLTLALTDTVLEAGGVDLFGDRGDEGSVAAFLNKKTNLFGHVYNKDKVSQTGIGGDDMKVFRQGLADRAENDNGFWGMFSKKAVDIGSGEGDIESLEELAKLSAETLDALLMESSWDKEETNTIQALLSAKLEGREVKYNDGGYLGGDFLEIERKEGKKGGWDDWREYGNNVKTMDIGSIEKKEKPTTPPPISTGKDSGKGWTKADASNLIKNNMLLELAAKENAKFIETNKGNVTEEWKDWSDDMFSDQPVPSKYGNAELDAEGKSLLSDERELIETQRAQLDKFQRDKFGIKKPRKSGSSMSREIYKSDLEFGRGRYWLDKHDETEMSVNGATQLEIDNSLMKEATGDDVYNMHAESKISQTQATIGRVLQRMGNPQSPIKKKKGGRRDSILNYSEKEFNALSPEDKSYFGVDFKGADEYQDAMSEARLRQKSPKNASAIPRDYEVNGVKMTKEEYENSNEYKAMEVMRTVMEQESAQIQKQVKYLRKNRTPDIEKVEKNGDFKRTWNHVKVDDLGNVQPKEYKKGEEWKEFRKPAMIPGNRKWERVADRKAKLEYKARGMKDGETRRLVAGEVVGEELTEQQYGAFSASQSMGNPIAPDDLKKMEAYRNSGEDSKVINVNDDVEKSFYEKALHPGSIFTNDIHATERLDNILQYMQLGTFVSGQGMPAVMMNSGYGGDHDHGYNESDPDGRGYGHGPKSKPLTGNDKENADRGRKNNKKWRNDVDKWEEGGKVGPYPEPPVVGEDYKPTQNRSSLAAVQGVSIANNKMMDSTWFNNGYIKGEENWSFKKHLKNEMSQMTKKTVDGVITKKYAPLNAFLPGPIEKGYTFKTGPTAGFRNLSKLGGRVLPAVGGGLALADTAIRASKGDNLGAGLSALSAVPVYGLVPLAIQILTDAIGITGMPLKNTSKLPNLTPVADFSSSNNNPPVIINNSTSNNSSSSTAVIAPTTAHAPYQPAGGGTSMVFK